MVYKIHTFLSSISRYSEILEKNLLKLQYSDDHLLLGAYARCFYLCMPDIIIFNEVLTCFSTYAYVNKILRRVVRSKQIIQELQINKALLFPISVLAV